MRSTMQYALGAVALGILLGGAPLMAQNEAPQDGKANEAQAATSRSEKGALAWVDLDAKTFAITTEDGRELQFRFTDETSVAGGDQGVAGLATMKGAPVTVEYEAKDGVAIATAITQQANAVSVPQETAPPAPEQ